MKKVFKSISLVLVAVVATCFFASCGSSSKAKVFSTDAGLSITLTEAFYEKEYVNATLYLESRTSIFLAIKEDFDTINSAGYSASTLTVSDYAEMVISSNSLESVTPTTDKESGWAYFVYEKEVSSKNFTYYAYCFKGSDAFWLCQFGCETKNADDFKSQFESWAKTIEID